MSTHSNLLKTIMGKQPILNIGCLGSVSDGKSTTVFQLTGTKTQRHSNEKTRNITIKPGYANMKIWRSPDGKYITTNSENIVVDAELIHHLSFVDCPGHQELILTMMGSVSLMKGAIVVVSAAEEISKKPQLIQHLAAAKLAGLTKLIILFNKLDLITIEKARERKEELDDLLERLEIKPIYIIPTALNKKIGLDKVIEAIMEVFPPELDDTEASPEFLITRSFDINKPGTNFDEVKGGVIGGSLITGQLKVGDTIEIRPGFIGRNNTVVPFKTKILSIKSEKENLDNFFPGGLIAIGTNIDPYFCTDDALSGNILGLENKLPSVYSKINMNFTATDVFGGDWKPKKEDKVYLQIGNVNREAKLLEVSKNTLTFELTKPSCISDNALIIICLNIEGDLLRIVGYGNLNSKKSTVILK